MQNRMRGLMSIDFLAFVGSTALTDCCDDESESVVSVRFLLERRSVIFFWGGFRVLSLLTGIPNFLFPRFFEFFSGRNFRKIVRPRGGALALRP